MQTKKGIVNWGIFIVLCIIWGSSFILMKWSKEGLNATQIASVRIFSAGFVFIPFAFFHFSSIPVKKLPLVLLSAVLGNLLPAYLFAAAIARQVDSSLAGILNSLTPIFVVVIGLLVFKSKIRRLQIIGVIVGFAGLSLLTLSKNGISFNNIEYALWIVLATALYGTNVNIVSKHLGDINPVHLGTVSLAFMTLPTIIVLWYSGISGIAFDEPEVQYSLVASVILGIVGSAIATVLFYMLVKNAGALFASLVTYGIPFISLAWGYIDGESVNLIQVLCLMIILSGVYLARK
ncbi:MAG: EamA family transporter [Terrimonas sp.]|nr:EamA family transporter [Terrimonas sp.]